MKKLMFIFSFFIFMTFAMSTVTALAQPKSFSQGFYSMKDLNLYPNRNYNVENTSPYADGFLIIIDSNKNIQQVNRIKASSSKYPLIPLQEDYTFIIYGKVNLVFS